MDTNRVYIAAQDEKLPRSWIEDREVHGMYEHRCSLCGLSFHGGKGRLRCRHCFIDTERSYRFAYKFLNRQAIDLDNQPRISVFWPTHPMLGRPRFTLAVPGWHPFLSEAEMSVKVIRSFDGDFEFLSNFWPVKVVFDGITYPSVEHAYQAAKTTDYFERQTVRNAVTAGQAKRAGRKVTKRSDWLQIKVPTMRELNRQKFEHSDLRGWLLATGYAILEEGNTWGDTFWGVCNGKGENNLGKILMDLRRQIREASE